MWHRGGLPLLWALASPAGAPGPRPTGPPSRFTRSGTVSGAESLPQARGAQARWTPQGLSLSTRRGATPTLPGRHRGADRGPAGASCEELVNAGSFLRPHPHPRTVAKWSRSAREPARMRGAALGVPGPSANRLTSSVASYHWSADQDVVRLVLGDQNIMRTVFGGLAAEPPTRATYPNSPSSSQNAY